MRVLDAHHRLARDTTRDADHPGRGRADGRAGRRREVDAAVSGGVGALRGEKGTLDDEGDHGGLPGGRGARGCPRERGDQGGDEGESEGGKGHRTTVRPGGRGREGHRLDLGIRQGR